MDSNQVPQDLKSLQPWFSLVRHARSVGKNSGLSVLQLTLIVDESGNPILFLQPKAIRLYPKESGREAINELLGKLMINRTIDLDIE
jgi:hypothetical protein